MEDWLKCQISPLVKYRQNQTKPNQATNVYVSVLSVFQDKEKNWKLWANDSACTLRDGIFKLNMVAHLQGIQV